MVSFDTITMTTLGNVRSTDSRSGIAGGITPTRMSTASHASGYWRSHASTSAMIPSGGTPGLTLATYPQSPGMALSESENRNIRFLLGNLEMNFSAFASVTTHGEPHRHWLGMLPSLLIAGHAPRACKICLRSSLSCAIEWQRSSDGLCPVGA